MGFIGRDLPQSGVVRGIDAGDGDGEEICTHDGGTLEDAADDPDPAGDDDGPLAADEVSQLGDGEGTDEGAGRHGGDDGALCIGAGVTEGGLVGVVGEDAGHGRDVQTEEAAADTCERADDVLWARVSSGQGRGGGGGGRCQAGRTGLDAIAALYCKAREVSPGVE